MDNLNTAHGAIGSWAQSIFIPWNGALNPTFFLSYPSSNTKRWSKETCVKAHIGIATLSYLFISLFYFFFLLSLSCLLLYRFHISFLVTIARSHLFTIDTLV